MRSFAAFVAHALFQAMRLGRLRRGLLTAYTVCVSTLALVLAMRGGQFGANGTFIAANGTTSNSWLIGGPSGPGIYNDAGSIILTAESDGGVTGENVYVQGAPGETNTRHSQGGAVLVQGGPASGLQSNGGNVSVIGGSVQSGNSAQSGSVLIAGGGGLDDGGSSPGNVNIVAGALPGTAGNINIYGGGVQNTAFANVTFSGSGNAFFNYAAGNVFSLEATGFVPGTTGGTFSCGAGDTYTVPGTNMGLSVTTSPTLTSNCIIDFTTGASSGFYLVDLSGVTLGATFGVQFKNGTATLLYTTASTVSGPLAVVWTHGPDTLAVSY